MKKYKVFLCKLALVNLVVVLLFSLFAPSLAANALTPSDLQSILETTTFYDPNSSADSTTTCDSTATATPAPDGSATTSTCCDTTTGGAGPTSLSGSDNQHKAYNFFIQQGLTPAQAVGILANLINESGVDPTSGAPITNGVGFGIAQWTFSSRQDTLVAYAAAQGKPVTDLLVQLQFMWQELTNNYKGTYDAIKQITTNDANAAGQVAIVFRSGANGSAGYEACDMSYASCSDRGTVATGLYPQYANSVPGGSTGSCSGNTTATGKYANPFPDGWIPNRLDMGYDGHFTKQIVSPCDGKMSFVDPDSNHGSNGGWEGAYFVVQCTALITGLPSNAFYFAEGTSPTVTLGQTVTAGQQIAVPGWTGYNQGPGGIEWGLADPSNPVLPLASSGVNGLTNCSKASADMVLSFTKWAEQNLKVAAPSAIDHAGCA